MAVAAIAEWVRTGGDAEAPPSYATVTRLNFSHHGWGSKEVKLLSERVLAGCPALTELSLGFNSVGDKGVEALCVAAKHGALRKLERLYLVGNQIGPPGCDSLAAVLRAGVLPACSYINLAKNPDTEETRWVIEELLKPEVERYGV